MTFKSRFLTFYLWTAFLYIGYQFTNRYQLFQTNELPLTIIDDSIPFMIWTIYPYFMLIALMYLPIFIKNDKKLFLQSIESITIAVIINYTIFIFYPTVYDRPTFVPSNSLDSQLYTWLISIDTVANCFPSGHITSPFIAVYFYCKYNKKWAIPLFLLFFLLSLSILTIKQHYLWDLFGGLLTAAVGICVAKKYTVLKKYY